MDGRGYGAQYRDSAGNLANAQSFGPIKSGNPYFLASVQQTMTANNIQTFTLGRPSATSVTRCVDHRRPRPYRAVASCRASSAIAAWKWDGYYQFGKNDVRLDVSQQHLDFRMRNAVDAVENGAGQIVCRINAGCRVTTTTIRRALPFNPFGRDRFSAAARRT